MDNVPNFQVKVNPQQSKIIQDLILKSDSQISHSLSYGRSEMLYYPGDGEGLSPIAGSIFRETTQLYEFHDIAAILIYTIYRKNKEMGINFIFPDFKARANREQGRRIQELMFSIGATWTNGARAVININYHSVTFQSCLGLLFSDMSFFARRLQEYDADDLIRILTIYKNRVDSYIENNDNILEALYDSGNQEHSSIERGVMLHEYIEGYLESNTGEQGDVLKPLPEPIDPVWKDIDDTIDNFKTLLGFKETL